MAAIDATATLADLVTDHPSLARPLEGFGLDYCCHGQRPLAEAVADAGHDLGEVTAALTAAMQPGEHAEWAELSAAELASHVQDVHHRYLWEEMPRLSALVDKIAEVHGANHPELLEVQQVYAQLRVAFEPHLRREELLVFPAIRHLTEQGSVKVDVPVAGDDHSLRGRLAALVAEHDQVGELLARLRELTGDYEVPADGCPTYRATYEGLAELEADTHEHVHKENNVLFPAAIRIEEESLQSAG